MGFNLREYDHVEKFTLYQCIERLKQEGLSTDIVMLLIFESVLDFTQEVSHIPIYGQHEKSYRFDARKYPGEMSEICNVYRWYQNIAVNPKALSEDFCDEDLSVLNTFFFDKKEFLDFFNLPYDQAIELENLSKPVIDSTELQEEKAKNAQLQAEIERLKAENAELKAQLQDDAQQQSAVDSEPTLGNAKTTRISQPQRDIFSLLVAKNYQGQPSRNSLFDAINADLEATGINNKGVSYPTFDNLIDEALRLTKTSLDGKQIQYSPFPSKITK